MNEEVAHGRNYYKTSKFDTNAISINVYFIVKNTRYTRYFDIVKQNQKNL